MKPGYFKGASFPATGSKDTFFVTDVFLEGNGRYTGHVYHIVNDTVVKQVNFPRHQTLVQALRAANRLAFTLAETGTLTLEPNNLEKERG